MAATAWASFTARSGRYTGTTTHGGISVSFHAGRNSVENFAAGGRHLFESTPLQHTPNTSRYHFSHNDAHVAAGGSWVNAGTVHGSYLVKATGTRHSFAVTTGNPTHRASFDPHVGTYGGDASPSGHRVQFDIDTHTVHGLMLGGIQIFSNAQILHSASGPSFNHTNEHFRAHGVWANSETVHGSICSLTISPSGCRDGKGRQTYTAQLKTKQ